VIDTNVLVSGLIWGGTPAHVVECILSGTVDAYASEETMREYFRILEKLTGNNASVMHQWKSLLLEYILLIDPQEVITECRDPKDNMFLECAVACEAKYIVSGDKDLISMNPFRNIEILKAQEFLRVL
jgi:putative PIN family toxin of toxin-antitoxin system